MNLQEQNIDTPHGEVAYWEAGQPADPVLLMVHGLTGAKENWEPNVPYFAQRGWRVIAPDLIGFGHSVKPEGEYTIALHLERLLGFLDTLDVERAVWVGNSMGGQISALAAIEHPGRVERLVLVDAAGTNLKFDLKRLPYDPYALLEAGVYVPLAPEVMRQMVKWTMHVHNDWMEKTVDKQLADGAAPDAARRFTASLKSLISIHETNLTERLGEIQAPTLVIWGERDRLLRAVNAQAFGKRIPGARVEIYEECGHLPQLEMPERFNRTVEEFCT